MVCTNEHPQGQGAEGVHGGFAAATFQEVSVPRGTLRVACWGDRPAGWLGIHGITASSAALAPVSRHLRPGDGLVAPDLRGRGASGHVPGPYGLRTHADDCAAVIAALGRPPVTVIGESMGGFVAVVLAARHPELVERIVLVDGGLPLAALPPGASLEDVLGPALARLSRVFPSEADYVDFWRGHPALERCWNPDVEAYVLYDLEPTDGGFRSRVSEQAVREDGVDVMSDSTVITAALREVICPMHLLRATRDLVNATPPLYPDQTVEEWQATLENLTSEVVEGTNHYTIMLGEEEAKTIAARASAKPTASPTPRLRDEQMRPPILRVDGLEVVYADVALVLRGVNIEVPDGAVVALLGANGAGKTTTLRAITGLLGLHRGKVTKGRVEFRGRSVTGLDPAAIVKLGVSQVMEGRRIFAELTVDENLRAGGFTRRDKAELRASYERVMTLFPILAERRRSTAGYLSGGEQQMLAIGRALMQSPQLLLLDEPSLGLAPIIVEQIGDVIRGINATGTSVLLVEQNATMALALADHGYVLENGRVVKDGRGEALLADREIQEFYLGVGEAGRRSFREVKSYRRKKQWSA